MAHYQLSVVVWYRIQTTHFLILCLLMNHVSTRPGKLTFIQDGVEKEVSTKECNSGVFLQKPTSFSCACITGVWAFYQEFCEKPVMFVGGDDYCFNMEGAGRITQVGLIGSYRYPFEPSISYFYNSDFVILAAYVTSNGYKPIDMDALGSWVTVMNDHWTLFSDTGESVCLKSGRGRRTYCTFATGLQSVINNDKWNYIVQVKLGCHSNVTVKADNCYPINSPNGREKCSVPPDNAPCPETPENSDTNFMNSSTNHECEKLGSISARTGSIRIATGWIPKPRTPPPSPPLECVQIKRETVKEFWLDPANNECGKSIVEAVFRDQLQRFAVTRFDQIFDSRLESLEQMKQLVYRSRDIIKKTCGRAYVPEEFLDVATDAFIMFINEDFFYGVEGADQEKFGRILKGLEKCYKRAKLFVFETKPLGCDLKKITGTLILPGKTVNVTVPDFGKSKNFETLIETAWKLFLNAHSYCYEDFQFPNDHHLFSTMFLELFSRSIYEKWIEPLANKQLYKLILPHFAIMKDIMENIDYCVAAIQHVSQCPVWLQRSSPDAKSIQAGDSIFRAHNGTGNPLIRKKRSWVNAIETARKRAVMWNGTSYCLQFMEEPSVSLSLAGCNEVF